MQAPKAGARVPCDIFETKLPNQIDDYVSLPSLIQFFDVTLFRHLSRPQELFRDLLLA